MKLTGLRPNRVPTRVPKYIPHEQVTKALHLINTQGAITNTNLTVRAYRLSEFQERPFVEELPSYNAIFCEINRGNHKYKVQIQYASRRLSKWLDSTDWLQKGLEADIFRQQDGGGLAFFKILGFLLGRGKIHNIGEEEILEDDKALIHDLFQDVDLTPIESE